MEIKILAPGAHEPYSDQILEMLYGADRQFVPPLSARSSTTQQDLTSSESTDDGIRQYFAQMQQQRFIMALEGQRVLGFVSYKEDYCCDVITTVPNIYLSTLVMRPEAKGRGLTRIMYGKLFDFYGDRHVFTRTWHSNDVHIHILDGFGFETIKTLPNHRGPGIHTVYFQKRPTR